LTWRPGKTDLRGILFALIFDGILNQNARTPGLKRIIVPRKKRPSKKSTESPTLCSNPFQAPEACVLMSVMRNDDLARTLGICRYFRVRNAMYRDTWKLDFEVF
jgi:hypothetical protein